MARGVRGLKAVTLLVLPIVLPPNDVIKSRDRRLFTLYGLSPFVLCTRSSNGIRLTFNVRVYKNGNVGKCSLFAIFE